MNFNRAEEMTALERVALTLQHKEADRVPVYPLLCGISRKLVNAGYKDWALNADITAEAYCKVTSNSAWTQIVTSPIYQWKRRTLDRNLFFLKTKQPIQISTTT